jgi:glycerophosphoryl diester phosphodiesterase
MLILSHRGYHVQAPENTMASFEQAVAMGVDGIETDIRMSADGLAVLFHDRLAPNGEKVSALTRAELEQLVGHAIPTVEEAVECFDGVLWNLEMKTQAVVDSTAAVVRKYGGPRRFLVSSFWHPVVERVSQLVDVECALLVAHRPLDDAWMPALQGRSPRVRTIVWNFETVDESILEESASRGLRNYVYGAQTPDEHRLAARWGIDGIITDRPEYLSHLDP